MSHKKNNRTLIIVFAVLLVAVVANYVIKNSRGERTFRDDIIEYKADDISRITFGKAANNQETALFREDTVWKLQAGDKKYPADQELAGQIVEELAFITPERLVATKKDLWKEYDVNDSAGVKLTVYGPKKSKTGLIIGRFSYNQSNRQPSTFLRLEGENEVFAVEGYLGMVFNRDINSLRDKNIFKGNRDDLTRFTFTYPDSSFTVVKENNVWLCEGIPADSARVSNYLNTVAYLAGMEFRDDFSPESATGTPLKLLIEGTNIQSVELKCYTDPIGRVVVSSLNPETFFSADKGDLFLRIYKGRSFFVPGITN